MNAWWKAIAAALLMSCVSSCGTEKDRLSINQPCLDCNDCFNELKPPAGPPYVDGTALPAVSWTFNGRLSPSGSYLAFYGNDQDYARNERRYPVSGLCIRDEIAGQIIHFVPNAYGPYQWGRNSDILYFLSNGALKSLSIATGIINDHSYLGTYERIEVSPTGNAVFLCGFRSGLFDYGVARWNLSSDSIEFITSRSQVKQRYIVANDTLLYSIILSSKSQEGLQGFYSYNTTDGRLRYSEIHSDLSMFSGSQVTMELSPDGKRILIDPIGIQDLNEGYSDMGVWIYDIQENRLHQVLDRHPCYLFTRQRPSWTSRVSFLANWYCAKDSSVTLNEYSLSGRVIRKLTAPRMKFWK